MAFKSKELGSNLFTLNESLKLADHLNSDESSIMDQPSDIKLTTPEIDLHREQIQKLTEEIESMKKQAYQIKLKNKQLKDALEIAQLHNRRHEEKQRQLIKKLSHQQIKNKQLQFQIKKAHEDLLKIKENTRNSDHQNLHVVYSLKKAQDQRGLFIQAFRKLADAISKCQKVEDFKSCLSKFIDFLKKNIKAYEQSDDSQQFHFDLKFQLSQISTLKLKISQLESKTQKLKDQLQRQRTQKRKQATSFNEKLLKFKEQCDQLKSRLSQINQQMNERENQVQMEINTLKKTITQKNQLISELKYRMDSEKKAKDSVCSRKSRMRKRSYYISDGERDQGGRQVSDIENEIEYLERQINQVMYDIRE